MNNTFAVGTTFDAAASGAGTAGTLDASGKPQTRRFYGKYRGKVADNIDPLFLGRILPIAPAISPEPLTWAMPCVPYAGPEVGLYSIPPIDANIWIEFEAGDPNLPIWTGCFWEEGEVPLETPPPGTFIFKTECTTLIIRDTPEAGGFNLEITPPAVTTPISINLDSEGIQVLTEALLSITSQETNMTSEVFSLESGEANISGESLTIESGETNIAGESLTIESSETNIAGEALTIESAATNIASDVVGIETAETNIASASLDIEAAETNIASAALTIEGVAEVTGDLLLDGQQVLAI